MKLNILDQYDKTQLIAEFKDKTGITLEEDDPYIVWVLMNQLITERKLSAYKKKIFPYIAIGSTLLILTGFFLGLLSSLKENNSLLERQLLLVPLTSKAIISDNHNDLEVKLNLKDIKVEKTNSDLILVLKK